MAQTLQEYLSKMKKETNEKGELIIDVESSDDDNVNDKIGCYERIISRMKVPKLLPSIRQIGCAAIGCAAVYGGNQTFNYLYSRSNVNNSNGGQRNLLRWGDGHMWRALFAGHAKAAVKAATPAPAKSAVPTMDDAWFEAQKKEIAEDAKLNEGEKYMKMGSLLHCAINEKNQDQVEKLRKELDNGAKYNFKELQTQMNAIRNSGKSYMDYMHPCVLNLH